MQTTLIPTPQPIEPMLARPNDMGDAVFAMPGYVLERKFDGTRIIAIKNADGIFLMSGRSWKQDFASHFPEIVQELKRLPLLSFVLDGELLFYKDGKCKFYAASVTREKIRAEGLHPVLAIFDIIADDNGSCAHYNYEMRHQLLDYYIAPTDHVAVSPYIDGPPEEYRRIFSRVVEAGDEGIILKDKNSPYEFGKRSKAWIKVKREETDDFVLLGITHGTGRRKNVFGALIVGQYDENGKLVNITKVGTGFTDNDLATINADIMKMPSVSPYFDTGGLDIKRCVPPELAVEVKFMQESKKAVRHPVFVRFREDKLPEDCVYHGTIYG